MKKTMLYLIIVVAGCTRSRVDKAIVINSLHLSAKTIVADGSSTISLSATIDSTADSTKRNVLFSASNGSFVGGKDSSISQKAVFVNGRLVATVAFVAPLKAGTIYFNARPDLVTYYNFTISDSITATPSPATKIKVSANSFAVHYGFVSEDTVVGKLSGASGGGVSMGTKVLFEDSLTDASGLHGSFRSVSASSNASSQVSAIYSPGFVSPIGTSVWVRVTVLDTAGLRTKIKDSVLITVIQ